MDPSELSNIFLFIADSFLPPCGMSFLTVTSPTAHAANGSLESALLALPLSGLRVFQRMSRYPARADPEDFSNGSGPDGFRCIAPPRASISESGDSLAHLSPWNKG